MLCCGPRTASRNEKVFSGGGCCGLPSSGCGLGSGCCGLGCNSACCGKRKTKGNIPETIEEPDKITATVIDPDLSRVETLQIELAQVLREIQCLKGDVDDQNYKMLLSMLQTHGDDSSETLLMSELAALGDRLSIQLSRLQQVELTIVSMENQVLAINRKSQSDYKLCQKHVMRYSRENVEFLVKISQLESQLLMIWQIVSSLTAQFEAIVIPIQIDFRMEMESRSRVLDDEPSVVIEYEDVDVQSGMSRVDTKLHKVQSLNQSLKNQFASEKQKIADMERQISQAKLLANQVRQENVNYVKENRDIQNELDKLAATRSRASINGRVDLHSAEAKAIANLKEKNAALREQLRVRESRPTVMHVRHDAVVDSVSGSHVRQPITVSSTSRPDRSLGNARNNSTIRSIGTHSTNRYVENGSTDRYREITNGQHPPSSSSSSSSASDKRRHLVSGIQVLPTRSTFDGNSNVTEGARSGTTRRGQSGNKAKTYESVRY